MGDHERKTWAFFKFKSKILNQERDEKYRILMLKYVDLWIKADKAEEDILSETESELTSMNKDVSHWLRLQAGLDNNKEASGNA